MRLRVAAGAVEARSEERRCARTGPLRLPLWGAPVSTDGRVCLGLGLGPAMSWGSGAGRAQLFLLRPAGLGQPEAGAGPGAAPGEPAAATGGRGEAVPWFLDLK